MVNHQIIDDRGTHLSPEDLAALSENLREQFLFRREQSQQLSASARMVLADVEAALGRMDRGDYGVCHLCRHPIDRERLMIVPQARYCARCQQVRGADR